jgi:D-alanyl-D-alanine-carboxypeptidase/D-alanyl-D-alanine-endopeptidase
MNSNIVQRVVVLSTDAIREILAKRIDHQKQALGIVVGVIEPTGRRIIAYGDLASGHPRILDGDTIFEIGSISKIFTSLLLADMVHGEEVALDDPAGKYLPEHVRMPARSGKSITLRDLSTHTSGLPRNPSNLGSRDPLNPYADYSRDDLYEFLSGYELSRDPGAQVEYSNLGAGLLGQLLADGAGTDYEHLIGTRITRPLGMPNTGITLSCGMNQRMATGHSAMLASVPNWDFRTLAGAGALRSSANDMLTFLEAFLGYRESTLAPAMKAMLEVRRSVGTTRFEVGLGWNILGDLAWHDGGTGGFRSWAGFDLNKRIGVVVLPNAAAPSGVVDIGMHLLNPEMPLANPEAPKQRVEVRIEARLLDRYIGRYQVTPNPLLEITRDGDRLFAQALVQLPHSRPGELTGGPKFELFAESEKKFFARVADNQITFEIGPDGRTAGLILHKGGLDLPGVRLS